MKGEQEGGKQRIRRPRPLPCTSNRPPNPCESIALLPQQPHSQLLPRPWRAVSQLDPSSCWFSDLPSSSTHRHNLCLYIGPIMPFPCPQPSAFARSLGSSLRTILSRPFPPSFSPSSLCGFTPHSHWTACHPFLSSYKLPLSPSHKVILILHRLT